MDTRNQKTLKTRLSELSNIIRTEQRRLLIEASNFNNLPNKKLLQHITDLELNIAAIDNTITELESHKTMKLCGHCGTRINDSFTVCTGCGVRQEHNLRDF